MEEIRAGDLKTILHSKRANLYYLEHCRVLVSGGRVTYVTDAGKQSLYWNIPIANTTTVLLGTGTSITQAAARELAKAGVMLGFCGGGGTPLFAGTEQALEVMWLPGQSEYRPTEYLQHWVRFWFDDRLRLEAAKAFQSARLERLREQWTSSRSLREAGFSPDVGELDSALRTAAAELVRAPDTVALLTQEARLTKQLFRLAGKAANYGEFTRAKRGEGTDAANQFLDHGNYLAYGLAATATWVLGIPHALAVLHGKTRRGGLVFDVADLVKDAVILPQAFMSAAAGQSEQEFRQACIESLIRGEALDFMIGTLERVAKSLGLRAVIESGVPKA
ncbi:type I-F CRISPR-associated endonuclease Cas1f [Piscinibacter sakaiensis]|uniref:CRISPR-associated endonuclease Cas1 n=1 Tax=Piscinibacter sakaiensis TaxID=1547922 RepID=A0A0K8P6A0_PISS1|nr:type I-F CRISPR-associated endonuclease Cas1f [Piscinibacter sakaiensis]GAP37735.1 CRISPR-associated protein Cas1 [Piscinibacter sakaiensis]